MYCWRTHAGNCLTVVLVRWHWTLTMMSIGNFYRWTTLHSTLPFFPLPFCIYSRSGFSFLKSSPYQGKGQSTVNLPPPLWNWSPKCTIFTAKQFYLFKVHKPIFNHQQQRPYSNTSIAQMFYAHLDLNTVYSALNGKLFAPKHSLHDWE